MKSPVIGGLVAEEESELVHIVFFEGDGLQADGAVAEPVEFGHVGDEEFFGGVGGGVRGLEGGEERGELGGIFIREEEGATG